MACDAFAACVDMLFRSISSTENIFLPSSIQRTEFPQHFLRIHYTLHIRIILRVQTPRSAEQRFKTGFPACVCPPIIFFRFLCIPWVYLSPLLYVSAAGHSRTKIRERNRAVYRIEVDQPGVKWRMFQEQCRKESRELACLEKKAREKKKEVLHRKFYRNYRGDLVSSQRARDKGSDTA